MTPRLNTPNLSMYFYLDEVDKKNTFFINPKLPIYHQGPFDWILILAVGSCCLTREGDPSLPFLQDRSNEQRRRRFKWLIEEISTLRENCASKRIRWFPIQLLTPSTGNLTYNGNPNADTQMLWITPFREVSSSFRRDCSEPPQESSCKQ